MKFIKWLTQHKKRYYKFSYLATGFMGKKYVAGTFEFKVSDREINNANVGSPCGYGFYKNYKKLSMHFPVKNGVHAYLAKQHNRD